MEKEKLEEQAIKAALSSNWQEAVELNQEILKRFPEDIDVLNRLGYAFFKLGKIKEARRFFKKVLKINRYNPVASKNLIRLKKIKKIEPQKEGASVSPTLFLEEPGKTKIITLVKIASQKVLSSLSIGQPVIFNPKRYSIEVRTKDKTYLGTIPDDLSFRLIRLIKNGYKYQGFVKNVKENFLSIFLREMKRGPKLKGQPSFATSELKAYFPYLNEKTLGPQKEEMEEIEEKEVEDDSLGEKEKQKEIQ